VNYNILEGLIVCNILDRRHSHDTWPLRTHVHEVRSVKRRPKETALYRIGIS